MYDSNNIFAKILRNEIPCNKVHEDKFSLFFHDISPQAKIHVLGIPKLDCIDMYDFVKTANDNQFKFFFKSVQIVIEKLEIAKTGYRVITNSGQNGGQEVPHFHIHILAGEVIGPIR